MQQQIPFWNDNKKSKNKGKCNSRSFAALRMTALVEMAIVLGVAML